MFRHQNLRSLCTGLYNSDLEERPEGNGHLVDLGADGRIVPEGTGLEGVDWIYLVISLGGGDWILGRPSDCLFEGSVRTLKNYFKTTGRNLNDVLKYTVDDFRRSSDES